MSTILEQLSTDGTQAPAYSARIVKTLTNNTGPFDRSLDRRDCLLLPTQVARAVAGSTDNPVCVVTITRNGEERSRDMTRRYGQSARSTLNPVPTSPWVKRHFVCK